MKCLPLVRPKMVSKLKNYQDLLKFGNLLFYVRDLYFHVKNSFYEIFTTLRPKLASKLKMLRIY